MVSTLSYVSAGGACGLFTHRGAPRGVLHPTPNVHLIAEGSLGDGTMTSSHFIQAAECTASAVEPCATPLPQAEDPLLWGGDGALQILKKRRPALGDLSTEKGAMDKVRAGGACRWRIPRPTLTMQSSGRPKD